MRTRLLAISVAISFSLTSLGSVSAQTASVSDNRAGVGDTLDNPPELAKLSAALNPKAIDAAMRKVGDWELERSRPYFSQDWTFAALYAGFMAAAKTLPEAGYEEAMLQVGNKFDWKLGPRLIHADDQAIGQTYIALYREHHD